MDTNTQKVNAKTVFDSLDIKSGRRLWFAPLHGARSTLIIDEPVEAEITIDLNILPVDSTVVIVGVDVPETGKPSVLVEQIE